MGSSLSDLRVSDPSLQIELEVQVEIVTGEVVDMIYHIYPVEKYGDGLWVKDYRKKADANANTRSFIR